MTCLADRRHQTCGGTDAGTVLLRNLSSKSLSTSRITAFLYQKKVWFIRFQEWNVQKCLYKCVSLYSCTLGIRKGCFWTIWRSVPSFVQETRGGECRFERYNVFHRQMRTFQRSQKTYKRSCATIRSLTRLKSLKQRVLSRKRQEKSVFLRVMTRTQIAGGVMRCDRLADAIWRQFKALRWSNVTRSCISLSCYMTIRIEKSQRHNLPSDVSVQSLRKSYTVSSRAESFLSLFISRTPFATTAKFVK